MPKRLNYSTVAAPNVTPIPATDMSAARAAIVNELWKALNAGGDPDATAAKALLASFEEQRCPQVLHGECSAAAMEEDAIAALLPDGGDSVTKEHFFAFHAALLAGFGEQTDREVTLLLRFIWKQNQPDTRFRTMSKADLAAQCKELFAASAFRGQTFQEEPLVDDTVDMHHGTENMAKLVPFAMPKYGALPAGMHGHSYQDAPILHHKTHCLRGGEETLKNHPAFTGEPHTTGAVAGNPKSRGFLDSTSHNKEYGGGALDDPVIAAVNDGKQAEQDAARARAAVLAQPYQSADPAHFRTTNQLEHLDFSKVAARDDPAVLTSSLKWTKTTDDIRGPRGLRPAGDGKTSSAAAPAALVAQEKAIQEHNRKAARLPPKFDASTTQRESFAPLDFNNAMGSNDRWAEEPTMHASQVALAATTDVLPRAHKNYGSLETEYSARMQDPGPNKDFSTKHHHPGVLDLKNGTSQMKNKWHRPREAPLGDSVAELKASTVTPRQFATTNSHFFAGQK